MKKILVIGTGGLAREFTSWSNENFHIIGYSSTNLVEHSQYNLPGVLYETEVTPDIVGTDLAVMAIGSPMIKAKLYDNYTKLGFKFPVFVHSSSTVSASAKLAEGVIISPNCVISPDVVINKLAYINFSCGLGHDAVIGEYSQINPGVQIGGFASIGRQVLVGSGATILQGVHIGEEATIGSGSVVFSSVMARTTLMGNPAKRMQIFDK